MSSSYWEERRRKEEEEKEKKEKEEKHNQRKKVGTALGKPLETRNKAGEDIDKDMPVDVDNHADNNSRGKNAKRI